MVSNRTHDRYDVSVEYMHLYIRIGVRGVRAREQQSVACMRMQSQLGAAQRTGFKLINKHSLG